MARDPRGIDVEARLDLARAQLATVDQKAKDRNPDGVREPHAHFSCSDVRRALRALNALLRHDARMIPDVHRASNWATDGQVVSSPRTTRKCAAGFVDLSWLAHEAGRSRRPSAARRSTGRAGLFSPQIVEDGLENQVADGTIASRRQRAEPADGVGRSLRHGHGEGDVVEGALLPAQGHLHLHGPNQCGSLYSRRATLRRGHETSSRALQSRTFRATCSGWQLTKRGNRNSLVWNLA